MHWRVESALPKTIEKIENRKFTISTKRGDYVCEFAASSERLKVIAKNSLPVAASETGHRNLYSFEVHAKEEKDTRIDKPRSFWVRNVDWDEDAIIDLTNHINFYMIYYDNRTPHIMVHSGEIEGAVSPQTRYIEGDFPETIQSKVIDPNILHFWIAARVQDPPFAFIYYYRVIEYLAVLYLNAKTRADVRKVLFNPRVLDDIQKVTEQLLLATHQSRQMEDQRLLNLLEDTLDPELLWREMQGNINSFTAQIEFDGGFLIKPFLQKNESAESFKHKGISRFAAQIKEIRNALSHGRDIKTSSVIAPTHKNFTLLKPWVILMCVAAGQVVLYNAAI